MSMCPLDFVSQSLISISEYARAYALQAATAKWARLYLVASSYIDESNSIYSIYLCIYFYINIESFETMKTHIS